MKQTTVNRPAKARARARNGRVDFGKLRTIPILRHGESLIHITEALRRARRNPLTNRGKRFAMKFAAACNAAKIPRKVWRIGWNVIFGKDSWRDGASSYAWYVYRHANGFCWDCHCFTDGVNSRGRLLRLNA